MGEKIYRCLILFKAYQINFGSVNFSLIGCFNLSSNRQWNRHPSLKSMVRSCSQRIPSILLCFVRGITLWTQMTRWKTRWSNCEMKMSWRKVLQQWIKHENNNMNQEKNKHWDPCLSTTTASSKERQTRSRQRSRHLQKGRNSQVNPSYLQGLDSAWTKYWSFEMYQSRANIALLDTDTF